MSTASIGEIVFIPPERHTQTRQTTRLLRHTGRNARAPNVHQPRLRLRWKCLTTKKVPQHTRAHSGMAARGRRDDFFIVDAITHRSDGDAAVFRIVVRTTNYDDTYLRAGPHKTTLIRIYCYHDVAMIIYLSRCGTAETRHWRRIVSSFDKPERTRLFAIMRRPTLSRVQRRLPLPPGAFACPGKPFRGRWTDEKRASRVRLERAADFFTRTPRHDLGRAG